MKLYTVKLSLLQMQTLKNDADTALLRFDKDGEQPDKHYAAVYRRLQKKFQSAIRKAEGRGE